MLFSICSLLASQSQDTVAGTNTVVTTGGQEKSRVQPESSLRPFTGSIHPARLPSVTQTHKWMNPPEPLPHKQAGMFGMPTCIYRHVFCATGGICLVNRLEQAAESFVVSWGTGWGLMAERTYEHQQHPAFFIRECRMHSCSMEAPVTWCNTRESGEQKRALILAVMASLFRPGLCSPSAREIKSVKNPFSCPDRSLNSGEKKICLTESSAI